MTGLSEVRVATFNLDESLTDTLSFLFRIKYKNQFILTHNQDEQICIFKVNTKEGTQFLTRYKKQFPDRKLIVLSREENIDSNLKFLISPVSPQRLMNAVIQASQQLGVIEGSDTGVNSQVSEALLSELEKKKNRNLQIDSNIQLKNMLCSASGINLDDEDELKAIQYSDDRYLQGRLKLVYLRGKALNINVHLVTPHGTFNYNPETHQVRIGSSNYLLRNLASIPDANTLMSSYTDTQDSKSDTDSEEYRCADALLWEVAVWASRGRLPMGVDIDKKFCLKRWPNFTRWLITPYAMELSAFWMQGPVSIRNTVEIMGIPQRCIFIFYSAAESLDLLEFNFGDSKNLKIAAPKNKSIFNGFLEKILDYVKPEGIDEV